jgi:hypothetical protein
MKWWIDGNGNIPQYSTSISFMRPPSPINNVDQVISSASKFLIDKSSNEPCSRDSESSDIPAERFIDPTFERELMGGRDNQPDGLKYPFLKPGIQMKYTSTSTIKDERRLKRLIVVPNKLMPPSTVPFTLGDAQKD